MKNWYLATYKDADGSYRTCLVLSVLPQKMRFTTIAARDTLLLSFEKWGLKPQKQKIAAVLQDHSDLQDCGFLSFRLIEFVFLVLFL